MDATQVTVREVTDVGPDTISMTFGTPEGFDADPGEFVLVRATVDGEELARHYTLSSPTVEDAFEITVGIDPDGDLTPWLAEREPGDTLDVEGPFGNVTYEGVVGATATSSCSPVVRAWAPPWGSANALAALATRPRSSTSTRRPLTRIDCRRSRAAVRQ